MELTRDDLPAAVQEHTARLLRGGLQGRFAQSFCVMQNSLDAMESVLQAQADPALRQALEPLVEEMARRLPALERLAGQAADLAVGGALRELHRPEPVELVGSLEELCACVNEELARRGSRAAMRLETAGRPEVLRVSGSRPLIDALLANLLSNSLRGNPDAQITLQLDGGLRLLYQDDGPGLPEDAWALLLTGDWRESLLHRGGTGLLLIREYAACMGWQISREGEALAFTMPPAPATDFTLYSSAARDLLCSEHCRARILRELDALAADMP